MDFVLCVVGFGLDPFEDLVAGDGHDSLDSLMAYLIDSVADHAVGLPRAGLPIGEKAAMIAFPGIVEDVFADPLEDLLLVGILGSCGF